jgi:hypothetical protein
MNRIVKHFLGWLQKRRIAFLFRKKIKKFKNSLDNSGRLKSDFSPEFLRNNKELWKGFGLKVKSYWIRVYISISSINNYRYLPEDIYYSEIEPRLNNRAFSKAYTDKNNYHRIIDNKLLPSILLRSISGIFYSQEYKLIKDVHSFFKASDFSGNYIIKPSIEGGGGSNVRKININGSNLKIEPQIPGCKSIEEIIRFYRRDFVIQEYIEQHSFFRQFNSSSLNTIRILTYRSPENEEIVILHRVLRIGKEGSIVDNQASGGIACGISEEGNLSSFGVNKCGNLFFESNGQTFSNIGKVPFIESISLIAAEVASHFLYSRLLGMDFAVDDKGKVLLIEVNDSNNEINFYQMNNGPLFGKYSEEVAKLCRHEPKSFLIDFDIL